MPTHRCFHVPNISDALSNFGIAASVDVISPSINMSSKGSRHELFRGTLAQALASKRLMIASSNGDSFCVRDGKAELSLTPSTFTRAGLDLRKARDGRYYGVFDPAESSKIAERFRWSLDHCFIAELDWDAQGETTVISRTIRPLLSLSVPIDDLAFDEWANSVVEWAALAVLGAPCVSDGVDLNPALHGIYPDIAGEPINVCVGHIEGPVDAAEVVSELNGEWSIVIVRGYKDAPTTPRGSAHCHGQPWALVAIHTDLPQESDYGFELRPWEDL